MKITMNKLNSLTILLLILMLSKLNAQQLSFDELVLLQKKNLTGINDYLMAKGWDYSKAEKLENDENIAYWSFKKVNWDNEKAEAWLSANIINGETISIQYQSTSKNDYNAIITKVKAYNMRNVDSEIKDDKLYTHYRGKNYSIKIIIKSDKLESANLYIFRLTNNYTNSDYSVTVPQPQANVVNVSDFDGNTYKTVAIGNQIWFAENLKTKKYNDGTTIPNEIDAITWSNLTTGAYCNYNNEASKATIYGRLYNWYAVNTGKLCPKGWHVPSKDEWITLEDYLINNGYNYDGSNTDNKIAKAIGSPTRWTNSVVEGTIGNSPSSNNRSGFSSLPGGYCNSHGEFVNIGCVSCWWSSTESSDIAAYSKFLNGFNSGLNTSPDYNVNGYSVRCLRN